MRFLWADMKTLMIHSIRKEYFELKLEKYRLTFDDGLYSQYYYYPLFRNYDNNLIYFIITSFIKPGKARRVFDGEHLEVLKSRQYMYDAFIKKELHHFMNVEELQELSRQQHVRIGSHSHYHEIIPTRTHPKKEKPLSQWKIEKYPNSLEIFDKKLSIRSKLAFKGYNYRNGCLISRSKEEWEDYIKYDTESCLKWFEFNLGFTPTKYFFPFNEHNDQLISILESFGFNEFYSARADKNEKVYPRIDIDKLYNFM